jgi:hypothetical protein
MILFLNKKAFSVLMIVALLISVAICLNFGTVKSQTTELTGETWVTPVPADQGTGQVIQTEISGGVEGFIPEGVYGAYPSYDNQDGWDLTDTPIVGMDIWCNQAYMIEILVLDRSWNQAEYDVTLLYGESARSPDGQWDIRIDNTTTPKHFSFDISSSGINLEDITRVCVNFQTGLLGFATNYTVTNITVGS